MKIALVLQGGSARGVFTSGFLDEMMNDKIEVDAIYGVSAGALIGVNYLSNQPTRSYKSVILSTHSNNFFKPYKLFSKSSIVNIDYYFNELNAVYPLDEETYNKSKTELCVSCTSLVDGRAEYFYKSNFEGNFNDCIKASASLPFVSKPVKINNEYFADGGHSDPFPVEKAFIDGYDKVIFISTRTRGYRQQHSISKPLYPLYKTIYHNFPIYIESVKKSYQSYNQQFERIEKIDKSKLFIVYPNKKIKLAKFETNIEKLEHYYQMGRKQYFEIKEELLRFVKS